MENLIKDKVRKAQLLTTRSAADREHIGHSGSVFSIENAIQDEVEREANLNWARRAEPPHEIVLPLKESAETLSVASLHAFFKGILP